MAAHTRRAFLLRSATVAGHAAFDWAALRALVSFGGLATSSCRNNQAARGGYGPLQTAGPELALPAGFTYRAFSIDGTPMADGTRTPTAHDGMAAFALAGGNVRLVRNHEILAVPPSGWRTIPVDPATGYDPGGRGGTVSLEIEPSGQRRLVRDFVSLSGTIQNCAGGPTPWGSWISCEETTVGADSGFAKPHGYCFEVPAVAEGRVQAVPLTAMGRFVHEAVAVDPSTGFVYETEDLSTAGFYRFLPLQPGNLAAGGRLQMLAISGRRNVDLGVGQAVGQPLPVTWVDIPDSDPASAESNPLAVFDQGFAQGGARFRRGEGCWCRGTVFFSCTNGGSAGLGQVWEYRPAVPPDGELVLRFESADASVLDAPDNLTVSPRGGILLCEDGGGDQYLRGLTAEGKVFDFALNLITKREFAGATFSPDGETLFVNIQGDDTNRGMTLAVWGPWRSGAL